MTQRVFLGMQLHLPSLTPVAQPDMGGTTGGEGESNIRIAFAWDPQQWPEGGPPDPPDMFWSFYLNDEVIEEFYAKEAGLEGLDSRKR